MKNATKQSTTLTTIEGKTIQQNSTHKAVERNGRIEIWIKGFIIPADNDSDEYVSQPEYLYSIPSANHDDLFSIFECLGEDNRINRAEFIESQTTSAKFDKGAFVEIPNHDHDGFWFGQLTGCQFNTIHQQFEYIVKTENGNCRRMESEIVLRDRPAVWYLATTGESAPFDNQSDFQNHNWQNFDKGEIVFGRTGDPVGEFHSIDAKNNRVLLTNVTPDWTSKKPFIVGQILITPSTVSRFIGHDKNNSACLFFEMNDEDGDAVNIDDVIDALTNHMDIDSKLFNEILSRVSMNLETVDSVDAAIKRRYRSTARNIVQQVLKGDRGRKIGQMFFTFIPKSL